MQSNKESWSDWRLGPPVAWSASRRVSWQRYVKHIDYSKVTHGQSTVPGNGSMICTPPRASRGLSKRPFHYMYACKCMPPSHAMPRETRRHNNYPLAYIPVCFTRKKPPKGQGPPPNRPAICLVHAHSLVLPTSCSLRLLALSQNGVN